MNPQSPGQIPGCHISDDFHPGLPATGSAPFRVPPPWGPPATPSALSRTAPPIVAAAMPRSTTIRACPAAASPGIPRFAWRSAPASNSIRPPAGPGTPSSKPLPRGPQGLVLWLEKQCLFITPLGPLPLGYARRAPTANGWESTTSLCKSPSQTDQGTAGTANGRSAWHPESRIQESRISESRIYHRPALDPNQPTT
jgi:hypothetical protein